MRLRNHNLANDRSHWSPDEKRQAIWFWIFWSVFVCLSAMVIAALLTDWPPFLHDPPQYFR
jgi:hypothetical protein